MKKKIKLLSHVHISMLVVFFAAACSGMKDTPTSSSISIQTDFVTVTIEVKEQPAITPTKITEATETPTQTIIPTSLPTFVQPPPPAPPSEVWSVYTHAETGMSFQYPANWFVYLESGYIYITNFQLHGLPLKGHDSEKVKIDLFITPIDITGFPSLAAYLNDPQQQPSTDDPGKIAGQIELSHTLDGYEIIRQTHTGFMGNPDATYEKIYVASQGKVIRMVYGEQFIETADKIAGTLIIPNR